MLCWLSFKFVKCLVSLSVICTVVTEKLQNEEYRALSISLWHLAVINNSIRTVYVFTYLLTIDIYMLIGRIQISNISTSGVCLRLLSHFNLNYHLSHCMGPLVMSKGRIQNYKASLNKPLHLKDIYHNFV